MQTLQPINNINTKKWFFIYCVVHLLVWTIGSALVRDTFPHDVAEGIVWGNQWQWGYDKHPPLTAWLVAFFSNLSGGSSWSVYLFSQIVVITGFFGVWRLASHVLPPVLALISVFLLQGSIYYNIQTPNITPDTMQTPIWAFVILSFYLALTQEKIRYWVYLGMLCGLAFLTKYQAAMLFLAMLTVLFTTVSGRQSFKTKGPYLCGLIFLVIILPHLIWSYQQGFPAIQYAKESADLHTTQYAPWLYHIIYPATQVKCAIAAIIVLLVMLIPFFNSPRQKLGISKFDTQYLFIMGLGPFIASLLYSAVTGNVLVARWNTPYFILFGILAMVVLRPLLIKPNFKAFMILFLLAAILAPLGRFIYLLYWPNITGVARADAYIPAAQIAEELTREWKQRFNTPLKYIGGDNYLTAYFSTYSPDKPTPFFWGNTKNSAWINEEDVRTHGAIFIWEVGYKEKYPDGALTIDTLKTRYPQAGEITRHRFNKLTSAKVPPFEVYVAFLPPQK